MSDQSVDCVATVFRIQPMANSDSDDGADGFKVGNALVINHSTIKVSVTILPTFLTVIQGETFTRMDIYRSRGLHRLLSCRVTDEETKIGSDGLIKLNKVISRVLKLLKDGRDDAFRNSVINASNTRLKFVGCTEPKNKRLKAFAMAAMGDCQSVTYTFPAIEGVVGECAIKFRSAASKRKNKQSWLWMALSPDAINYVSSIIAHGFEKFEEEADDDDDDRANVNDNEKDASHDEGDGNDHAGGHSEPVQALITDPPVVASLVPKRKQASISQFFVRK